MPVSELSDIDRHDADGKAYVAYYRNDLTMGFIWSGIHTDPVQVTREMGAPVIDTFLGVPAHGAPSLLDDFKRACDAYADAPGATAEDLQRLMDFDHPVTVRANGTVTDAVEGVYAPEVYHVEGERHPHDVEVQSDEWETFSVGYTGQQSYNGAVMHASEYIDGQLANDILDEPGTYVVVAVEVMPDDDDPEPMPAGWTILRRKEG